MTTTVSPLEKICTTLHPIGEFEDPTLDIPDGASDMQSATGWQFLISVGALYGEDENVGDAWILEKVWVYPSSVVSLTEALDFLILANDRNARNYALRFRDASPTWILHDVRADLPENTRRPVYQNFRKN